jgi:hypothetical protein
VDKAPEPPAPAENSGSKGIVADDTSRSNAAVDAPSPGAASAKALSDAAMSIATAAAAEASAAAAAAVSAALDAANAIPSPAPTADPATNAAAAAEVIYASGAARTPSVLDSQADVVAQLQQHAHVMVGSEQQVAAAVVVQVIDWCWRC